MTGIAKIFSLNKNISSKLLWLLVFHFVMLMATGKQKYSGCA
jgi:hypothetical protein